MPPFQRENVGRSIADLHTNDFQCSISFLPLFLLISSKVLTMDVPVLLLQGLVQPLFLFGAAVKVNLMQSFRCCNADFPLEYRY